MGDRNGKPKIFYDCTDCPAFCCSVYDRVQVTPRDIRRLAKHFGVTEEVATARFTKMYAKERVLRRKRDELFGVARSITRDPQCAESFPSPNAAPTTI
jgi:hypothetical protein